MAFRTVFENHSSTTNTNPDSYDATTLAVIKPRKHQSHVDPLLQSGVVARNYLSNGCNSSSVPKF